MPASFTRGQKDSFVAGWRAAKQYLPAVLALGRKYDVSGVKSAADGVDSAITPWLAGTLSDDNFLSFVAAVEYSLGITDEDGNLVIDSGGPDAAAINNFANAIPSYSAKTFSAGNTGIEVTGAGARGSPGSSSSKLGMILLFGAAAIGLAVVLGKKK